MFKASIMLISFSFVCQAQTAINKVAVSFTVDMKKEAVSYKVKFSLNGKEIEPSYVDGGFLMPEVFNSQQLGDKQEIGIKMILGDKEVDFLTTRPDTGLLGCREWLIVIDKKPFEPDYNPVLIEMMKDAQIIYTLKLPAKKGCAGHTSYIGR